MLGLSLLGFGIAAGEAGQSAGPRPAWTRRAPRIERRAGKRYAVAVGAVASDNLALARAAAEERARANLLRFLQRKAAFQDLEGRVVGAVVADSYAGRDGMVWVRLELPLE